MPDSNQSFGQQLLGSLKNGLSDAVGGLPGTAVSMGVSAFNNWLADRAAQKQFDRQIDFWEMQNEYNTPLNQRKRLEEAGLNPVAAAGGIGSNNTAGQLSSVPGNQYAQNGVFDPNVLQNNMMLLKQMESIGANTDLLERQVELSFIQEYIMNAQAYGLDLSNEERKKLLGYIDREKELSFEKVLAEIDKIKAETVFINTQESYTDTKIQEVLANVEHIKQSTANLSVKTDYDTLLLNLAQKYNEEFLKLDLEARKKEVQEFLDTSDVRLSLYNAQIGFARLAMNEAERTDALNAITSEYERHIAQQILNAAKDGKTSLDAVFLKYFTQSPGAALQALSSLSKFAPKIHNHQQNINL